MIPTTKTCSKCNYWMDDKVLLDSVLASECAKLTVANSSLGTSRKVTKGSDSCSNWAKPKYRYDITYDEMIRDLS